MDRKMPQGLEDRDRWTPCSSGTRTRTGDLVAGHMSQERDKMHAKIGSYNGGDAGGRLMLWTWTEPACREEGGGEGRGIGERGRGTSRWLFSTAPGRPSCAVLGREEVAC